MRSDRDNRTNAPRPMWLAIGAVLAIGVAIGAGQAAAGGNPGRSSAHATARYLQARQQYLLDVARSATSIIAAQNEVGTDVRRDCPGVLRGAPRDGRKAFVKEILLVESLTARKTSVRAQSRFSDTVSGLRWPDPRIAQMIARLNLARRQILKIALPNLCDDAREWEASHFKGLAPNTLAFDALLRSRLNRDVAEGRGTLEASIDRRLLRYETAAQRKEAGRLAHPAFETQEPRRTPAWVTIADSLGMLKS